MVVNKIDLLPYVPFSIEAVVGDAKKIQPDLETFEVCAIETTGVLNNGISTWCDYLQRERRMLLAKNA